MSKDIREDINASNGLPGRSVSSVNVGRIFYKILSRFYPPGHGNIFTALETCGLLDELIKQGRDVIFVSNVDNTAACVDVKIASVICRDDVDYCMEITEKTQQDIKVF